MKCLTVDQPYAQLLALGIKTLETRSWPAPKGLIGQRIAIHAAARKPDQGLALGTWSVYDDRMFTAVEPRRWVDLPLGAVVGSAVLTACVPMVERTWPQIVTEPCLSVHPPTEREPRLVLWTPGEREGVNVTDQLPFGDFRPGRWAWICTDAAPCEDRCPACWGTGDHEEGYDPIGERMIDEDLRLPCTTCDGEGRRATIPAKGRQRVWEWRP